MKRYPGLIVCILLIAGVQIGRELHPPDFATFCILATLASVLIVAVLKGWRIVWKITAAVCIILLGIFRYNLVGSNIPANHISHFNGLQHEATIYGALASEPDLRPDDTYLTVRCDSILLGKGMLNTSGLLLVKINQFDDRFNYADMVSVEGHIRAPTAQRNFHDFDYKRHLALKRISSCITAEHPQRVTPLMAGAGSFMLSRVVIPLREYILGVFSKHIEGAERHLIAGFLIGETRFIPLQVYERFRNTGTLHLLAVSGSNVALLVGTVILLFKMAGLPRRLLFLLSLVVIAIFCQLSFNQPSVIRASLMISLVIIGKLVYRKGSLVNIVAVAAVLILIYDPLMLYDVGFQLSFVAAFSLVYFIKQVMPKPSRKSRWKKRVLNYGVMIVLSTLVVELMVAPILASYFGKIPLVSFLSNLVVIPLSSMAVVLSLLLIMLAPIPILSDLLAIGTQLFSHLSIRAVDLFSSLPVVTFDIGAPDPATIVLYYLSLFALFAVIRSRRNLRFLLVILLAWGVAAVWKRAIANWTRTATVTFLDLGEQYGLHVHIPEDYNLVITNADSTEQFDRVHEIIRPYLRGEGVEQADMWLQTENATEISPELDLDQSQTTPHESRMSVTESPTCSIKLTKSPHSIEMAQIQFEGRIVDWLAEWSDLPLIDTIEQKPIDILALPYPGRSAPEHFEAIKLLKPRALVIYNHPFEQNLTDIDFLSREMKAIGVKVYSISRAGAVQFQLNHAGIRVKTALDSD